MPQAQRWQYTRGDTGVDVIERFLQQNGFTGDFTGKGDQRYLSRIHKSGAFSGGAVNNELAELIKMMALQTVAHSMPTALENSTTPTAQAGCTL